jgi:hypothetical protein
MKNYVRAIAFLVLSLLLVQSAIAESDLEECLARGIVQSSGYPDVEFSRPALDLIHVVRGRGTFESGPGSRVIPFDYSKWLRNFLGASKNPQELQRWWTAESQGGQIWTKNIKIPYYDPTRSVSVEFKLKPGYAFFDVKNVTHEKLWESWNAAHSHEPNAFSKEQVNRLNEMTTLPNFEGSGVLGKSAYLAIPNHSQFYEENKLAGLLVNGIPERGVQLDCWNIVNFDAIEEIRVNVPNSVEISSDLKHSYIFTFAH